MVRLKVCYSHLACKATNKCLNVCKLVEVVERKKKWSFPGCPHESSVSVKESPDIKKTYPKDWMSSELMNWMNINWIEKNSSILALDLSWGCTWKAEFGFWKLEWIKPRSKS